MINGLKRVVVGVSGGIDSAATVMLLSQMGYEVTGLHMVMVDSHFEGVEQRVLQLSSVLGIKVEVVDLRIEFKRCVLDRFAESYMIGETPSPCTWCNPAIKWTALRNYALGNGFDNWATGHYCRIVEVEDRLYVRQGVDALKDQSYYLWAMSAELLERALMPLGDYLKSDIKKMMALHGHDDLVEKRESMGLCFLKNKGYQDILRDYYPEVADLEGGQIVTTQGDVIGKHRGYPFYTVAQRKGIEGCSGLSVKTIDASANRLIVAEASQLFNSRFCIGSCKIVDDGEFFSSERLRVKVRGVGVNPCGYCHVRRVEDEIEVVTDDPAWALAVGQPVVFYIDDRVVGGGTLTLILD